MIKFSLLLCTLNREELLKQCVLDLLNQTYTFFEIVIVDQSDSVNKAPYLADHRITYVHIQKKGLSNARNVGMTYITGDFICLIDDDALYYPDWLQTIADVIKDDPAEIICGRVKDPISDEFALGGRNCNISSSVRYFEVMKYGISPCCIFQRNALEEVGFDDRFGVGRHWGAGEETDAIWSIMERNGRMKYVPQIVVIHSCPSKESIPFDKIASYNLGFGALFAKHRTTPPIMLFAITSFMRNIAGFLYYYINRRPDLSKIQWCCLQKKFQGFREYLKEQRDRIT